MKSLNLKLITSCLVALTLYNRPLMALSPEYKPSRVGCVNPDSHPEIIELIDQISKLELHIQQLKKEVEPTINITPQELDKKIQDLEKEIIGNNQLIANAEKSAPNAKVQLEKSREELKKINERLKNKLKPREVIELKRYIAIIESQIRSLESYLQSYPKVTATYKANLDKAQNELNQSRKIQEKRNELAYADKKLTELRAQLEKKRDGIRVGCLPIPPEMLTKEQKNINDQAKKAKLEEEKRLSDSIKKAKSDLKKKGDTIPKEEKYPNNPFPPQNNNNYRVDFNDPGLQNVILNTNIPDPLISNPTILCVANPLENYETQVAVSSTGDILTEDMLVSRINSLEKEKASKKIISVIEHTLYQLQRGTLCAELRGLWDVNLDQQVNHKDGEILKAGILGMTKSSSQAIAARIARSRNVKRPLDDLCIENLGCSTDAVNERFEALIQFGVLDINQDGAVNKIDGELFLNYFSGKRGIDLIPTNLIVVRGLDIDNDGIPDLKSNGSNVALQDSDFNGDGISDSLDDYRMFLAQKISDLIATQDYPRITVCGSKNGVGCRPPISPEE